jgi:hypothetical protein
MLPQTLALALFLGLLDSTASAECAEVTDRRMEMRHRQRRIIYNKDTLLMIRKLGEKSWALPGRVQHRGFLQASLASIITFSVASVHLDGRLIREPNRNKCGGGSAPHEEDRNMVAFCMTKDLKMKTSFVATLLLSLPAAQLIAEEPWVIQSPADWRKAEASANGIAIQDDTLVLERAAEGQWTSKWHAWQGTVDSAEVVVYAEIDLFDNKTIERLVEGSKRPYTDGDRVPHDWYGRCMIAIVDENRWIMALRSGVDHISWGDRDTIHLITSTNEGRTWSALNCWFDGTPIEGLPYEDGHTHSEPGLFRMPNGDLVLQFWRTSYTSGTKQLRSSDDGKTWPLDIDRISVTGVPGADDDMAIGTEDYFVDPESPSDIYMAFQYFHFNGQAGTLLARSRDNCRSYSFVSWIGPLADQRDPDGGATFEPAIEYVGQRTIVAVMRDAAGNRRTWQTVSTNMGASFETPVDISDKINGGIPNGLWQTARLMIEADRNGDGTPDASSAWYEICSGRSVFAQSSLSAPRWRIRLQLTSHDSAGSPRIRRVQLTPDAY